MRITKQECVDRLDVFEDTHELSGKLLDMAEAANMNGDRADAYYLKECAIHMDGLFDLARVMASRLAEREGEKP